MSVSPSKPIRSPSYPNMSLRDAVAKVGIIESQYRSSAVDRLVAVKLIGYSGMSGPANMALAALASYGLVERAAKGEMRVTPRARAILHPQNEEEKHSNLRAAALEPSLFQELNERFPGIIPPLDGVVTHLNRQGFNPSAVKPAAKAFLDTMTYIEELGASESHGSDLDASPVSKVSGDKVVTTAYGGARVGDFIQWESQGALQFPKPLRVRLVTDDGQWVAVEGSETGIPMNEVIVESSDQSRTLSAPPTFSLALTAIMPEADKGETEWMRMRVDQDTNVRILIKGDIGPKGIGKLIKILEAQKLVLEDD